MIYKNWLDNFQVVCHLANKDNGAFFSYQAFTYEDELGKSVYIKEDISSCVLVATTKVGIQFVLQHSPTFWYSHGPQFYYHAWVNFQINFTSL